MNFIEIQSWPEIPSIGYFVSLFSQAFNLPEFPDIEDLEEALLLDGSENNDDSLRLIPELIVSLLRGCDLVEKPCQHITTSNYQMFLRRLFRYKCEEFKIENPFNTDTDFHILPLRTKVVILYLLCEFRLDSGDVETKTGKLGADNLRINPLGYDSNDSVYWYFYGTRLYREDLKPKVKGSASQQNRVWQVICFTEQDWIELTAKFKNSKSRKESALYKALDEDFLPSIPLLFKAKEAEHRRRLFQKRSSLRVNSILERRQQQQLEQEEKSKQQQELSKQKIEEKIRNDRANRANRRSSSISSSLSCLSVGTSCELQSQLDFDSAYETTERAFSSNKENILDFEEITIEVDMKTKKPTSAPAQTKLPGRQTNNSLSSITGQIIINPAASTSTTISTSTVTQQQQPRKKKPKADDFMDSDEVLNVGMHKVLMTLKNHDDAWPFVDPVEEEIAPRYYSIIKRPMDLLKMEEKLDNGEYRTFSEFKTDFKLIVNNCRLYNGQNNEYTSMVNNLQIAFDRGRRKYFDQSSSDEEQVLLEYPPIENANNRANMSKAKDVKVEKSKQKEKKIVQSENESENELKNEKVKHKKVKNLKNQHESKETDKKVEKNMNSNESKKSKSTKGVKRKSNKSKDHVKSKKMKKEIDNESDDSDSEVEEEKSKSEVVKSKDKEKDKKKKKSVLKQKNVKPAKIENTLNDKKNGSKKSSSHVKLEKGNKVSKKAKNAPVVQKSFHESSDDDDSNSVRDLIEENVEKKPETFSKKQKKSIDQHHSPKNDKKAKKTSVENTDNRKNGSKKSKKQNKKLSKENDLPPSPTSSRSSSPLLSSSVGIVDDLNNSFDSSDRRFDSLLRSETPEIKDKFDLIKERRNRMNQQQKKEKEQKVSKSKIPSTSSTPSSQHKEKHKSKDKPAKEKLEKSKKSCEKTDSPLKSGTKSKDKEANSLFDKLKFEDLEEKKKVHEPKSKKSKVKSEEKKESGSHKTKEEVKDGKHHSSKSKKQSRASLDVLDMETEQTLKDINKWLEHTPRFEYSSASNSPSRYVIDELDMPSKLDDDFRKPIPLMPSSPSASQTNFHSPKDLNLLKESNNNNKNTSSLNQQLSGNSKKNNNKETKRKNSRDKLLQNVPKKKEVQRTIDRLQPGKTKGNLLTNIQNINKPDEIYPLGSREKLKEVKNSLIVETDESSPKLSLGTVLDNQSFNLIDCEKINKNEKFGSLDTDDDMNDTKSDLQSPKKVDDLETLSTEDVKLTETAASAKTESSSKPNINAWFKAFGAPKKPKKVEEDVKMKESERVNPEGNYVPSQTRRLSTGSSISERSSESSPHVGIDERGAPAPYPSPIGTSPMPSPKIDDSSKPSSSSYGVNGSTRVGFYQDMTSIKSSPEKSCSPREAPYSQYSQQSHYSNTSPSTTSPHYGSFYPENPSPSRPNQQATYSKPTHSPAPYYDQYKQPMSQESDFNNSMSPNTNPNSPYHSQQSSPYQQQPNSPFQSGNTISPNNQNLAHTSNAYVQPTSPYQQQQQPVPIAAQKAQQSQVSQSPNSPNNIAKAPTADTNPAFQTSQSPMYPQQQRAPTNTFDPSHRPAQDQQYRPPAQKPEWSSTQQPSPYTSQQLTTPHSMAGPQSNPPNQITQDVYSQNLDYTKKKSLNDLENAAARIYAEGNKSVDLPNPTYPPTIEKVKDTSDNNKYLDLSKQVPPSVAAHSQHPAQSMNQYQQMFDLSNYSKHGMDYDVSKSKSAEAYSRAQVDKSHAAGFWGSKQPETSAYTANQDHSKTDLTGKTSSNTSFPSAVPTHQQVSRSSSIDPNYKPPIFNNPATSSMMDLTAFMRDFRPPDDRYTPLPGTPGSFYDKNIPPAHMFSKNLPQTATSAALQQMFNNSTMSYSRNQQAWNASQASMANLNQAATAPTAAPVAPEAPTKAKKPRKSKKNASPEPAPSLHPNYQSQSANQYPQQHAHHQQAMPHQQPPFQSYGGLKIPPNSADSLKAVGSAFNYGPAPGLGGLYGENPAYLDDFRNAAAASNPYYPPPPGLAHRSTPESQLDKTGINPPAAHPQAPAASPYHHLLPAHHPSRSSYPFMNTLDPAAIQQQYRMMLNQTYQGYHPALSMHNQWPHHM